MTDDLKVLVRLALVDHRVPVLTKFLVRDLWRVLKKAEAERDEARDTIRGMTEGVGG